MVEFFHKMGFVAYPLAVCSIILIAIFLERIFYYAVFSKRKGEVEASLQNLLAKNASQPKNIRDEIVSVLVTTQQNSLYSGLKWLRLIGLLTPLVGLFGTIIGLINSFMKISSTTGSVNPALVADGLYLAMLTTAYGLAIALPALFFASIFKFIADSFISKILDSLNNYSLKLEGVEL